MIRISKKQVIIYHAYLIERFGGMPGIRDEGMLDSALRAAFATFDGKLLYPDARQRAAKLVQGLICNHPFNDGNKRIGVGSCLEGCTCRYRTAPSDLCCTSPIKLTILYPANNKTQPHRYIY